ncbi:MAG: GNAT family N-acetyltransferase [Actinomycetota bacterium]|nr:GNAT family N-acetyltransferase [Actinomycetota bacterium]
MAAVIRAARPREFPNIAGLVRDAGLPPEGLERAWATWVVEEEDVIVGSASLERCGSEFLLRAVVVAGDRRGRGLGTALVRAVLEAADEGRVWLLTHGAASWFRRFGFVPASAEELPPGLAGSPLLRSGCCSQARVLVRGPGLEASRAEGVRALEEKASGGLLGDVEVRVHPHEQRMLGAR